MQHKSVPAAFWGHSADEVAASRPALSQFATPIMTLDRAASDANTAVMFAWCRERGLELAPHGKTTMSPELWHRLLDAGAWGITLATMWQVQVARAAGVPRVLLANELVDPVQIRWIAAELDADPAFSFACWVDSLEGVDALGASAGERPIEVLVELGDAGGRTGARGIEKALAVAEAAAASPRLRVRGVAGYEGSYGSDRSPATVARVRGYLGEMRELLDVMIERNLFQGDVPLLTAGGSAWFDLVAEAFIDLPEWHATVVLRSGAFQAHDDVFYDGISPFADTSLAFRPALHAWARVVSRPEPALALLDAGKRDVPSDLDLPVVAQSGSYGVPGARITQLNDQHAHLALAADSTLAVGDTVRLGISHPCTAFDKWRLIPEIDDADADEPQVIGFIETWF